MLERDYLYRVKQKLITGFLKATARYIRLTEILRIYLGDCLKVMICRTGEKITIQILCLRSLV